MTSFPNPLIPGFNPDPSIVAVDGVYYVVTSSFEYLPGLPIYRSTDMVEWTQIGHVATRPEQIEVGSVPSNCGVYAPTIRWRDGIFYVIVSVMYSPVGCVVFTATDPAGPWSDGLRITELNGIDPDLAWDDEGNAYVTYSAYAKGTMANTGIAQARVDLETGRLLETPRSMWQGTGGQFPEAPHVFRRGEWWYLAIAEGGTERGHAVSIARARDLTGPFESCPSNPILTARGTKRQVQNTGHMDMVEMANGEYAMVLLGVRPQGITRSFSPMGRETFATPVEWIDDWPMPAPVELNPRRGVMEEVIAFDSPAALLDPGWIGVRALPADIGRVTDGRLLLSGGRHLSDAHPAMIGRRQRHLSTAISTRVDAREGTGGLAGRYDEISWFSLSARTVGDSTTVTATASLSGIRQTWSAQLPAGDVELRIDTAPPSADFSKREFLGGDRIRLSAVSGERKVLLADLDGRYWTSEVCTSFTGRVIGLYAEEGSVAFSEWYYRGWEAVADDA